MKGIAFSFTAMEGSGVSTFLSLRLQVFVEPNGGDVLSYRFIC